MKRRESVVIRRREQGQKEMTHEMARIIELRQRFGITRVEHVARAMRISEKEVLELHQNGLQKQRGE